MKKVKKITDALEILELRHPSTPQALAWMKEFEILDDIARKVYDARKEAKLSQKKLAELTGVSTKTISDIEWADYQKDYAPVLDKIAKALNLDFKKELKSLEDIHLKQTPLKPHPITHNSVPLHLLKENESSKHHNKNHKK